MDHTLARTLLSRNGWKVSRFNSDGTWKATATVVALIACVTLKFEVVSDVDGTVTFTGTRDDKTVSRAGDLEDMVNLALDTKFRAEKA